MSVQKIIKESMEKNPLNLKEALQEELKTRMSLALEAKMKEMEDEGEELDEASKSMFVDRMDWKGSKWVSSPSKNVPAPLEDIFGKVYSSGKVQQIMLIRQTRSSPVTGLVLQTGLTPKKVRDMINDYNPSVNSSEVFKIVPGKMWVYVDTPLERIKESLNNDELDESIKVGDKVKISASGLKGFPRRGGKIGTVVKDYGDGDFKVNMGGNDDISISGDDLIKEAYDDEDVLEEGKDYIDSNASSIEKQVSKDLSRHFKMSKSLKHNYNKKLFTLFLTAKGNNERFEVDVMYKEKRGKYMVDRIVIRQGSDVVTDERIDDLTLFNARDVSDVIQDLIQ